MKALSCISLSFLFLTTACHNSKETEGIMVEIQNQAQFELENQIVFKLTSLAQKTQESEEKYGASFKILDNIYKRLVHLKEKEHLSKTNILTFHNHIKELFQNELKDSRYEVNEISLNGFYNDGTPLKRGALYLKALVITSQLTDILYYDIEVCGWRFHHITSYPLDSNPDTYQFTLIGGEEQRFSNKNYQIDSILLNGEHIHLQSQILPNTMANVSISCEEAGDYEVFGHMDYTSYDKVHSLPFEHYFELD